MKTICKADDCFGCLSCLNVCPKDCISVSTDTTDSFVLSLTKVNVLSATVV